jgi:surfactin synthase thioesterase subunit
MYIVDKDRKYKVDFIVLIMNGEDDSCVTNKKKKNWQEVSTGQYVSNTGSSITRVWRRVPSSGYV